MTLLSITRTQKQRYWELSLSHHISKVPSSLSSVISPWLLKPIYFFKKFILLTHIFVCSYEYVIFLRSNYGNGQHFYVLHTVSFLLFEFSALKIMLLSHIHSPQPINSDEASKFLLNTYYMQGIVLRAYDALIH